MTTSQIASLDPGDMLGKTLELARQIEIGIGLGRDFLKEKRLTLPAELDWFGLGGSAIVGDLMDGLHLCPVPLRIWRQPGNASGHALRPRIVYSYSGNTVESLHAFDEAVSTKQVWLSVSSGGQLAARAHDSGIPHLMIPKGYPPRAAVGFGLGAFMVFFAELSSKEIPWTERESKALAADVEKYRELDSNKNPALHLAEKLKEKTPILYARDPIVGPCLVRRACAQFAENAKTWSHGAILPELAHNEVEAFPALAKLAPAPYVLFIGDWPFGDFPDPWGAVQTLLSELKIEWRQINFASQSPSQESRILAGLRPMLFLDAVSVYLALLLGENPLEIPTITKLKRLQQRT
ncbi:MAG: SIS domain-containing protein [bacterium]